MSQLDEIKEDISFNSKLLVVALAIVVTTTGGTAGLFLSGSVASSMPVFYLGVVVIAVLFVVSLRLYLRCRRLIRRLGEVK